MTASAFLHAPDTSHTEQFIVNALRNAGNQLFHLLLTTGAIVGHAAVSFVSISNGAAGWYGLGPIYVMPERQGEGVGSPFMKIALDELQGLDAAGCVVLGDPGYYARFGFRAVPTLVLPNVPPEYFPAISFGGLVPTGTVHSMRHSMQKANRTLVQ